MPSLDPTTTGNTLVSSSGLWRPFPLDVTWWQKLLDLYNYPASILPSVLLVAVLGFVLLRRGARLAAAVWVSAWVVVNAAELASNHLLSRPALHWTNGVIRLHVEPFDNSYPSGHTVRSVVVAAFVASVFPRVRWPAAIWLLLVPVALVVSAPHVVTHLVGGLLLGALNVRAAGQTLTT